MIFDIGANIGKWTLENINSGDKFICIEASPSTFNKLFSNLGNNQKVTLLNYAICDNNGEDIKFYDCDCNTLSTINKAWLTDETSRFYNYGYKEISVKTLSIDNLIEKYGIPKLIKIDTEGGEFECLKSLSVKVEDLCFEWASETNEITFKCLDHLKNLGFSKFYIQDCDEYTFRPNNSEYKDFEIVKSELLTKIPKKDWGMIWCK